MADVLNGRYEGNSSLGNGWEQIWEWACEEEITRVRVRKGWLARATGRGKSVTSLERCMGLMGHKLRGTEVPALTTGGGNPGVEMLREHWYR